MRVQRLGGSECGSHTEAMICCRECTAPGSWARWASRSNSRGDRATSHPPRRTSRVRRSISSPPAAADRLRPWTTEAPRRIPGRPPPGQVADGATGHGPDAGDQLPHAERLGDTVVRPELQSDDPVGFLTPGSDHDDRDRGPGAQTAADSQTVHVGQPEVEQHQIGLPRGPREPGGTVGALRRLLLICGLRATGVGTTTTGHQGERENNKQERRPRHDEAMHASGVSRTVEIRGPKAGLPGDGSDVVIRPRPDG